MASIWDLLTGAGQGVLHTIGIPTQPSQTIDWQKLLGVGGIVGGVALDKEPGEVAQARQALRNNFTSPVSDLQLPSARAGETFLQNQVQAPADPFAAGGAYERYLPQLQTAESDVLKGVETRYNAAFPAGIGMQGSATMALRKAAAELANNREALIANLLREQQNRQESAARALLAYGQDVSGLREKSAADLLNYTRPDPAAAALSRLGALMLLDRTLGGGQSSITNIVGGGQGGAGGAGGVAAAVAPATTSHGIPGVGPLEGISGIPADALSSISGLAGQGLSGIGAGATGALSALIRRGMSSGVLPALGAGVAGGATGFAAAPWLTDQANSDSPWRWLNPVAAGAESLGANNTVLGGITGAESGAAAGFLASGFNPLGGVIGAITGAIGGLVGTHARELAIKANRHAEDMSSQQNNFGATSSFWTQALGAAGIDTDAFSDFVKQQQAILEQGPGPFAFQDISGVTDQGEAVAHVASTLLLRQLRQAHPEITSLDALPGFRENYIKYLAAHIQHEGGITPTVDTFGSLLDWAGLSR